MWAVNTRQLKLPKVKEVKRVKLARRSPQPQVRRYRVIKRFELLHRPFDIRFRGRINKWLVYLSRRGIKLADIIEKDKLKIIKLYFYPQGSSKRWFNQFEVLDQVKLTSKKKLKSLLVDTLIQIWTSAKN